MTPNDQPQNDRQRFWQAVFGDMPEGPRAVVVWGDTQWSVGTGTLPEKTVAAWLQEQVDIYVRVSYVDKSLRLGKHRGTAEETMGLVGVYVDLDYGDHGHGKRYAPDFERAIMVLDTLRFSPSIIVHTGRGVHGQWLFREPWIFANDADRVLAADVVAGWQQHIRDIITQRGWTLESTANLDRVLRLPGTFNHKYGAPWIAPCTVSPTPGLTRGILTSYRSCAKTNISPRDTTAATPASEYPTGTFTINLDADILSRKLEQWLDMDSRFKQTWNRKRKDLEDQSASAYDLAIANAAVRFHCTDQEIVDLCIAWRVKHDELDRQKAEHEDYWRKYVLAPARAAPATTSTCNEWRS